MATWVLGCFLSVLVYINIFVFLIAANLIIQPKPQFVKEVRESLLAHLTAVLGNDGVAAHFVLLHLLSKVEYLFAALTFCIYSSIFLFGH